jgi:hypothetical protein
MAGAEQAPVYQSLLSIPIYMCDFNLSEMRSKEAWLNVIREPHIYKEHILRTALIVSPRS